MAEKLFEIADVEVFAAGTWNGRSYDETSLNNIVSAFSRVSFRPSIKIGHDKEQKLTDGLPSLGRISALKKIGNKLLATLSDLPKKIYDLIQKKAYHSVSSEIFINLEEEGIFYPYALKAVSLLGSDIPAVSTLKEIEALYAGKNRTVSLATIGIEHFKTAIVKYVWEETTNEIRYRVRNPDDFLEDSFRRKKLEGVEGVSIIVAKLKPENVPEGHDPESMAIQAYRFEKKTTDNPDGWTMDKAKEWIEEHKENHSINLGGMRMLKDDEATEKKFDKLQQQVESLTKDIAKKDADIKAKELLIKEKTAQADEFSKQRVRLETLEENYKKEQVSNAVLREEMRKDKVASFIKENTTEQNFNILPAEQNLVEGILDKLTGLPAGEEKFTLQGETPGEITVIEAFKRFISQRKLGNKLFREFSKSDRPTIHADPSAEVSNRAKKYMQEHPEVKEYTKASQVVLSQDPALKAEYLESIKRK